MPGLIYLDNASTSWPKPAPVGPAMAAAVAQPLGTPGRGGHAMAGRAAGLAARLRERLAGRIGATDPRRVVLTSGATESLNIAVMGILAHRRDRPRVVTTAVEHNSLRRPLEYLSDAGTIELVTVGCDDQGLVSAARVLGAVDGRTAMVAMSHASNVTGTIQPVEEVGRALGDGDRRAPFFLVDASPTVGLLPLFAQDWGIDLVAFSGHKALLGPAGTGALYVSPRAYSGEGSPGGEPLRPTRLGGTGADSITADMPRDLPGRFEPGTPNVPGMAGLLAAIEDPARESDSTALARERALALALIGALQAAGDRVRVLGPTRPEGRTGVVSVSVEGCPPAEGAAILEQSFGVITRAGLHCAPGIHRALGTLEAGGTIRLSPGPATTDAEVQTGARGILELCRVGV